MFRVWIQSYFISAVSTVSVDQILKLIWQLSARKFYEKLNRGPSVQSATTHTPNLLERTILKLISGSNLFSFFCHYNKQIYYKNKETFYHSFKIFF